MASLMERFIEMYGRLPTEFDKDYLELLQMTKYRILEVPDFKPSKCANCGTTKNDGRKYIDFGLIVDWFGTVYLCGLCLKDIATQMGLFVELENKLADMKALHEEVLASTSKEDELNDRVIKTFKEYEEFYARVSASRATSDSDGSSNVVVDETTIEPSINQTKSRVTKSTSSSGRSNVSSLADLLNSGSGD